MYKMNEKLKMVFPGLSLTTVFFKGIPHVVLFPPIL